LWWSYKGEKKGTQTHQEKKENNTVSIQEEREAEMGIKKRGQFLHKNHQKNIAPKVGAKILVSQKAKSWGGCGGIWGGRPRPLGKLRTK